RYSGALVTIDTETMVDVWGFTRRDGEAKQVYAERLAEVRRGAIRQLVEWHTNGAEWSGAVASWGEFRASVWGIDDPKYAQETAETEMRDEVADKIEAAGYIVTGRPETVMLTAADRLRQRIRENLKG